MGSFIYFLPISSHKRTRTRSSVHCLCWENSSGLSSDCRCTIDKWKRRLSCSGDASEDPGSCLQGIMAAMLRGTCPAIGCLLPGRCISTDLEFKNFFDLRVWNTFRTLHSGGRLIFWVKDTSMRDYLLILKMDQLKAMCADFVAIDWCFDHHEPRYLLNDAKWPWIDCIYKM